MGSRRGWVVSALVLCAGVLGAYLGHRAGRSATPQEHAGPTDPLSGAPAVDADGTLVGRMALRLDEDTWEEGEEITGKVWFEAEWSERAADRSRPLALAYPYLSVQVDERDFRAIGLSVEFDVTLPSTIWVRHRYEISFRVRAEPTLRGLAAANGKSIAAVPAGAHSIRALLRTNDPHRPSHSMPPPGIPPKDSTLGATTEWGPFRVVEGTYHQPSQEEVLAWLSKPDDATWTKVIPYYMHRRFPTAALVQSVSVLFSATPDVLVIREGPDDPYFRTPHIPFRVFVAPGQELVIRNDGNVMHNVHLICETGPEFNESLQPGGTMMKNRAPMTEGLYVLKCDVHSATRIGWLLVVR